MHFSGSCRRRSNSNIHEQTVRHAMNTSSIATDNSCAALTENSSISAVLSAVGMGLSDLGELAGKEFLELGASLQLISQRSKDVAAASRELVSLTGTGDAGRAITTLQNLLVDATRVQALSDTSQEKLREVLSHAERSRSALARLEDLPPLLSSLRTLSRIEGARLSTKSVNVSSLTEEMQRMAVGISQHIGSAANEARNLTTIILNGVQRLEAGEDAGRRVATDLVNDTGHLLDSFRKRSEAATHGAQKIDEDYAGVRRATDDLVMMLQFEDITRQRVEHVQEALRCALDHSEAKESASILALQRSQLVAVRDLLSKSLSSIASSLESLGSRLDGITAETAALASQTGQDGRSFATGAERLTSLGLVLGQYLTSVRYLVDTVNGVLPSLEKMASAVHEVKEIQASIRLMSLNARIKTAQLAEDGEAMGAIAAELHKATTQSDGDTRVIIESLTTMQSAIGTIAGHEAVSTASKLSSGSGDAVKQDVDSLLETIVASGRRIPEMLLSIHNDAGTLKDELRRASDLAKHCGAVIERLDSILAQLDDGLRQLGGHEGALVPLGQTVQKISTLYSMSGERDVHRQNVEFDPVGHDGDFSLDQESVATKNSELGDNVELF